MEIMKELEAYRGSCGVVEIGLRSRHCLTTEYKTAAPIRQDKGRSLSSSLFAFLEKNQVQLANLQSRYRKRFSANSIHFLV
jgi:hypothetical protein